MREDASQTVTFDLRIAEPAWGDAGACEAFVRRVLEPAAARLCVSGEAAILLTGDEEMHALNRRWRGLDKPTDVLSFPGGGPAEPGQPPYLGDIAMAFGTASRDAAAMGRSFEAHMAHLLIHGFLHLLGYDHIEADDARVMEALEIEILAGLGWDNPYLAGPGALTGDA